MHSPWDFNTPSLPSVRWWSRPPSTLSGSAIAVALGYHRSEIGMFFCCPFDALLGGTMATYAGQIPVPEENWPYPPEFVLQPSWKHLWFWPAPHSDLFGGVIPCSLRDTSETVVVIDSPVFNLWILCFYIHNTIVNIGVFIQGMGCSLLAILAGVCRWSWAWLDLHWFPSSATLSYASLLLLRGLWWCLIPAFTIACGTCWKHEMLE